MFFPYLFLENSGQFSQDVSLFYSTTHYKQDMVLCRTQHYFSSSFLWLRYFSNSTMCSSLVFCFPQELFLYFSLTHNIFHFFFISFLWLFLTTYWPQFSYPKLSSFPSGTCYYFLFLNHCVPVLSELIDMLYKLYNLLDPDSGFSVLYLGYHINCPP